MARTLQNKLVLTTAIAAAVFGHARQADAACAVSSAPDYLCSGVNVSAQSINADNANVSTAKGFSVNTTVGNAVTITGDGTLSFTDVHASNITTTDGDGLYVHTTADDGLTPGSITIDTNGNITGSDSGLHARNNGSGALAIHVKGDVTGTNLSGINAISGGTNLTVTIDADSNITGGATGIFAKNFGEDIIISTGAHATVTGDNWGIVAYGYGSGILSVSNGADAIISGGDTGIFIVGDGAAGSAITNDGTITGNAFGIKSGFFGTIDGEILNNGLISADAGEALRINANTDITGGVTNNGTFTGVIGMDVNKAKISGGIHNTANGTIEGTGGIAIDLVSLTGTTPIHIDGGHIIGDVIDDTPGNNRSPVYIDGNFTTQGNFDVSDLTVDAAKTLTVSHNNTVTLDHMSSGAGTISFGVTSTADFGTVVVTSTPVDLSGSAAPVGVTVTGHMSDIATGQAMKIMSGNGAIIGGPAGILTTVQDNYLWTFQIADGTNTSDGVSGSGDSDLWLHVTRNNNTITGGANTIGNANVGNLLETFSSSGIPALQQMMDAVDGAADKNALNKALERFLPTVNGQNVTMMLDNGARVSALAEANMIAFRNGDDRMTGMAAGASARGVKMWMQGYGQSARQSMRGNIAGYDADTLGAAVGVDTENLLKGGLVGLSFNYGQINANAKNANRTGTDIGNYGVSLYASHDLGDGLFLDGQAGYAYNQIDNVRYNVLVAGDHADANTHSDQFSAKILLGNDYAMDKYEILGTHGLFLTPNVSAAYTRLMTQGYTETGNGGGLNVRSQNFDVLQLGTGINAYMKLKAANDGSELKPMLHAGYTYAALNDRVETTASFIADPTNTAFITPGPTPARSTFNAGIGLTYTATANWDLTANYDYTARAGYAANAGLLRGTVYF